MISYNVCRLSGRVRPIMMVDACFYLRIQPPEHSLNQGRRVSDHVCLRPAAVGPCAKGGLTEAKNKPSQIAEKYIYAFRHHVLFSHNYACRALLPSHPPSFSPTIPPLVAAMARSALSVFVAVASASYAVAQTPTFPATPLASIVVPYSEIVCQVLLGFFLKPA
jgi:hypothetical protein